MAFAPFELFVLPKTDMAGVLLPAAARQAHARSWPSL